MITIFKRKGKAILLSLLAVLFMFTQVLGVYPLEVGKALAVDEVVNIPDIKLQVAIRTAVSKPTGDLTKSDLERLTDFDAYGRGIVDLTGLEYAKNLKRLSLMSNSISNLTPLKDLVSLEFLSLDNNQISDISALSGLTSLKFLGVGDNQISSLAGIDKLVSLGGIDLTKNHIVDISPLLNLPLLKTLNLFENQVRSIAPLAAQNRLEHLYIDKNPIVDVTEVSKMTNLKGLTLGMLGITDISFLKNLTSLTILELGWNSITDISPLGNLTQLESVSLFSNQVQDIRILETLPKLEFVDLRRNPLYSFSGSTIAILQGRLREIAYDPIDTIPPVLLVTSPADNLITRSSLLTLTGITEPGTTITVNNKNVSVDMAGDFKTNITLVPGLNTIVITANDSALNFISLIRNVTYDVTTPVESVTLDKNTLGLIIGATKKLIPILNPVNASNQNVTWSSSNPEVAVVDQNGNIVGVSVGTATITVCTEDGLKTASCDVTVTKPVPPSLKVTTPSNNYKTKKTSITISGTVQVGCSVKINGVTVTNNKGKFTKVVSLKKGTNAFTVTASDSLGNVKTIVIKIIRS